MRLDGALKPRRGAPAAGSSSPGARCDRFRAPQTPYEPLFMNSDNHENNHNHNNNSNNNNHNSNIVGRKQQCAPEQALEPPQEDAKPRLARTVAHVHHTNNSNNNSNKHNNNNNRNNYSKMNMAVNTAVATARPAGALHVDSAYNSLMMMWLWMMLRVVQSLGALRPRATHSAPPSSKRPSRSGHRLAILLAVAVAALLPPPVCGDDGDNFFAVNTYNMAPETTTPEFDYASRGQKKFGDKCENTLECGFPGSICDPKKRYCQCTADLPVTNHIDKCGKEAAVNETCFFNEQCETKYFQTECRDGRCACRFEMSPIWAKDGTVECKGRQDKRGPGTYIDPAMIGVLVGMALMFIIICVVLRLFSQARWRENRTIFNTPNPRLMNVSLLRDSKLLHGQERRGSRMSVRAPSRQPSMASLRPHSPNPSLGSGEGSHASNASATSVRSARSNSVAPGHVVVANSHGHHERKGSAHRGDHHHPHPHQPVSQHQHHTQQSHGGHPHPAQSADQSLAPNITANPTAESVTVEIIGGEK